VVAPGARFTRRRALLKWRARRCKRKARIPAAMAVRSFLHTRRRRRRRRRRRLRPARRQCSAAGARATPPARGARQAAGQCGAAQTHLERQGVGIGDVFVFFGLFREEHADGARGDPHHRIFGYLRVEEMIPLAGGAPDDLVAAGHPHALALHSTNDMIWRGEGRQASRASDALRLTVPGASPSLWQRPKWLKRGGLSYHDRADRWIRGGRLRSVARGQEFVADIGRREAPRRWLEQILAEIRAS